MNRILAAHLALFSANFIYGLNYTIAKEVMPEFIKPFGFIFCRVTGALLLFLIFHRIFFREKVERKDYFMLAICGLFGVAINQMMFFKGLDITTPINASIIMTTNPILVLIIAAIWGRESMTGAKIGGVGLGISGAVILIAYNQVIDIGGKGWIGDLLIFVNSLSYAVFLILVKPLMDKYKPITVIKWVFIFGYVMIIPFSFGEFMEINWIKMPALTLWETAFVIIGSTFLAYLLNIYGLNILNPSVASSYIYLQPLLAGLIAVLAGKDALTPVKIFAALLIFTGVFMVSKSVLKKPDRNLYS